MGCWAKYECDECGFTQDLFLGVGMRFPLLSDEVRASIAEGEYGAALKEAHDRCELPAVHPERKAYACPSCGCWDVYEDATLYEPADVEAVKKEKFGIKTVEEWGKIPYIGRYEIEAGKYHEVCGYSPACPECGGPMGAVPIDLEGDAQAVPLKCPNCGSADATLDTSGWWD